MKIMKRTLDKKEDLSQDEKDMLDAYENTADYTNRGNIQRACFIFKGIKA